MKVLIVDDTTFIRMTLRKLLEKNGFEVVGEGCDGYDAVQRYKVLAPDFVIMDISMPVMDGIEAVRKIRAYDATAQIIICSMQGQRANVMEAIRSGASSFLIKPIDEQKMLREISKLDMDRKPEIIGSKDDVKKEKISPSQAIAKNLYKSATSSMCEIQEPGKESVSYQCGVEAGYIEAQREIATNLYRAGVDLEIISNCVELSEEEIIDYAKAYGLQ